MRTEAESKGATRKLASLHGRMTLYELAVDGKLLAGYCQHGKANLLAMLRKHGPAWAERLSETDRIEFDCNGKGTTMGQYRIQFTGRTQRQAIVEGELPWALDAIAPKVTP